MNMKYSIGAVALTMLVTPALAADAYYVVQNTTTKACTVVEQKPTVATTVLIGTSVYKTLAEAEAGMKADKVCAPK